MKQELSLPKLRLPGQTNWLVRSIWILAGVAAVWLVAVLLTLWQRGPGTFAWFGKSASVAAVSPAAPAITAGVGATATIPAAAAIPAAPVATRTPDPSSRSGQTSSQTPASKPVRFAGGSPDKRKPVAGVRGRARVGKAARPASGKVAAQRGPRSAAARKAWLRNHRPSKARAGAKAPARATAAAAPARSRSATARPAAGKDDAIDEILRNFK